VSFSAVSARTTVRLRAHARDPDGRIRGFTWYFGDGSRGHRASPAHTYSRAGTIRVRLRVIDSDGNWAVSTRTIRVR
jgi:microbial collagenase